jgi:hypothetical protein
MQHNICILHNFYVLLMIALLEPKHVGVMKEYLVF